MIAFLTKDEEKVQSISPSMSKSISYVRDVLPVYPNGSSDIAKQLIFGIKEIRNNGNKSLCNTSAFNKKCNNALRTLAKIDSYANGRPLQNAVLKISARIDKIFESSKYALLQDKDPELYINTKSDTKVLDLYMHGAAIHQR